MLTLKVINLWSGPCVGKSTTAAALFNMMKANGHSVELVTEYAKDVTYEQNFGNLQNQLLILAEQDKRLRRLEGQVEWAITDSPLPSSLAYMTPEYQEWLPAAVWGAYHRYENYDILLQRNLKIPYQTAGRNQTELEAHVLDNRLSNIFYDATEDDDFAIEGKVDFTLPHRIYHWLMDSEVGDE